MDVCVIDWVRRSLMRKTMMFCSRTSDFSLSLSLSLSLFLCLIAATWGRVWLFDGGLSLQVEHVRFPPERDQIFGTLRFRKVAKWGDFFVQNTIQCVCYAKHALRVRDIFSPNRMADTEVFIMLFSPYILSPYLATLSYPPWWWMIAMSPAKVSASILFAHVNGANPSGHKDWNLKDKSFSHRNQWELESYGA